MSDLGIKIGVVAWFVGCAWLGWHLGEWMGL